MPNIDIRVLEVINERHVRDFALERMQWSARRFEDAVSSISVTVRDVNGPKGGASDHECVVIASAGSCGTLVVREKGDHALSVVSRAARRLRRRLAQTLGTQVGRERGLARHA